MPDKIDLDDRSYVSLDLFVTPRRRDCVDPPLAAKVDVKHDNNEPFLVPMERHRQGEISRKVGSPKENYAFKPSGAGFYVIQGFVINGEELQERRYFRIKGRGIEEVTYADVEKGIEYGLNKIYFEDSTFIRKTKFSEMK